MILIEKITTREKKKSANFLVNTEVVNQMECLNLLLQWVLEVFASKFGLGAKLFLNSQQLVVFGKTLRAARGTSLDLKY